MEANSSVLKRLLLVGDAQSLGRTGKHKLVGISSLEGLERLLLRLFFDVNFALLNIAPRSEANVSVSKSCHEISPVFNLLGVAKTRLEGLVVHLCMDLTKHCLALLGNILLL
jgi:hypothetical protein